MVNIYIPKKLNTPMMTRIVFFYDGSVQTYFPQFQISKYQDYSCIQLSNDIEQKISNKIYIIQHEIPFQINDVVGYVCDLSEMGPKYFGKPLDKDDARVILSLIWKA